MRKTDVNTLSFGVEIECTIPYDTLTARGWRIGGYHRGVAIPGHQGWTAESDASIQPSRSHVACEVVSPVMSGLAGLRSIEQMIETLNVMGAAVNRSTGFHVNIGWTGNPDQLRRLVCLVAHFERALFASTGTTSRDANHYCSSIALDYRGFEGGQVDPARFSRYHVINLQHVNEMGRGRRVEFRVFAGTLNIVKILAYVQLCLGLVCRALDNSRALPFDIAAIARKRSATAGDGQFAMSTLLHHLVWRAKTPPNGRTPVGVIDPSRMRELIKMLRKMAKQYDKRRRTGGAE
jgi:hypothetical protein